MQRIKGLPSNTSLVEFLWNSTMLFFEVTVSHTIIEGLVCIRCIPSKNVPLYKNAPPGLPRVRCPGIILMYNSFVWMPPFYKNAPLVRYISATRGPRCILRWNSPDIYISHPTCRGEFPHASEVEFHLSRTMLEFHHELESIVPQNPIECIHRAAELEFVVPRS